MDNNTDSSFSSDADDEYLLRAVNAIEENADDQYLLRAVNAVEENEATYANIRDLELSSWLDENSNSNDASLLVQPSALHEELAAFRGHWNAELTNSSRAVSPPPMQSDLADKELADVLRQIDSYECRQLPCAPPDEINVGASTSALVEVLSLKRQSKPSKGKEKAKKMAFENGL
jgi:hypothetical protein